MNNPTEWSFAFFDLGAKEAARRARLHRNLRDVGAAIHSQSVYCMPYSPRSFQRLKKLDDGMFVVKADVDYVEVSKLVEAYDSFIVTLIEAVDQKMIELEDAKASSSDRISKRGYTKRLYKQQERVEQLEYIASLRSTPEFTDKIEEFRRRILAIDEYEPGKLI